MYGSRCHAGEENSISLDRLPPFLHYPWAEVVYSTIGEGRCRFYTVNWEVRHPLLLHCSSKLATRNTVRDASGYCSRSTNDPKSSGTNFIEGHTSSLVLYLLMTMPDDEVCDVTSLWQNYRKLDGTRHVCLFQTSPNSQDSTAI